MVEEELFSERILPTISQLATKRRFTPTDLYRFSNDTWEVSWANVARVTINLHPEVCNSIPTTG